MPDSPILTLTAAADRLNLNGVALAEHYGDAAAELQALRESVALVDGGNVGLIEVRGGDAISFLQRILTQDVKGMPAGSVRPCALLEFKGQLISTLWIDRRDDANGLAIWIETPWSTRDDVMAVLDRYVITEDVALVDRSADFVAIDAIGPSLATLLSAIGLAVPAAGMTSRGEVDGVVVTVLDRPLGELPGAALRVPAASLDGTWVRLVDAARELGGRPAGHAAFEVARVEQAVPRFGVDLVRKTLLPEAGLDQYISYTKGCFVGQETMARLRSRGSVNKRLAQLQLNKAAIDATPSELPVALWTSGDGAKEGGTLTSVGRLPGSDTAVGLGYARRSTIEDGVRELHIGDASGPAVTIAHVIEN